jgi:ABC-type multidrug transport system ATPase subunit
VLWAELSVDDNLKLMAKLKGLSGQETL